MAYQDLNLVHNPATGGIAPAAWGDQIRDNQEFLIDPPAASVFHNTTQSVATSTSTVLLANSETFDNDSMHSNVTNNSRITIQTPGRYLFIGTVSYAPGTGRRITGFFHNGTTTILGATVPANGGGGITDRISVVRAAVMAAGDYMEVQANQNTGGALACQLDEFFAMFLTR